MAKKGAPTGDVIIGEVQVTTAKDVSDLDNMMSSILRDLSTDKPAATAGVLGSKATDVVAGKSRFSTSSDAAELDAVATSILRDLSTDKPAATAGVLATGSVDYAALDAAAARTSVAAMPDLHPIFNTASVRGPSPEAKPAINQSLATLVRGHDGPS